MWQIIRIFKTFFPVSISNQVSWGTLKYGHIISKIQCNSPSIRTSQVCRYVISSLTVKLCFYTYFTVLNIKSIMKYESCCKSSLVKFGTHGLVFNWILGKNMLDVSTHMLVSESLAVFKWIWDEKIKDEFDNELTWNY